MDGSCTDDYGTGGMSSPTEGRSTGQRCQSVDSLAEWRSSEQLENGVPSTSPPYWDTDDDDDEAGPRPSELYGKFTWKIENYSQINKRELRSNAFEVGGYKWYILIYPQGCDVCNHLSLFLCVANHDKLLPGWSHFAQFTIAVVNKDTKKSKFSDTLHRFWKKEHDWGWKKFMELSKVEEGFVNNETLVIKAQVQVIRYADLQNAVPSPSPIAPSSTVTALSKRPLVWEKVNRPFRCLACQYRRELVRVYLSNVEQICRRFFEDRKNKLGKLIEDKVRWSSFCAFWLGIDQNCRRRISRDKLDTILRVVVKQFFVEKEVTSTLVMDSLYSGLRSLESQNKSKKERMKIEMEESPAPLIRVDKDMFVLADDILLLLERVASEPLPAMSLPPKDDKVSQNRTKDGCSADDVKDSIERDERRLTELGRRTIEIFVLSHIFSSIIEVAYQEAVALKRQEELIREEEAAGQAEHELKAKRIAAEKDKRAKKKQGKKKPNNRKSKEKQRELKYDLIFNDKKQEEKSVDEIASVELSVSVMNERMGTPEDASDVSCNGDEVAEPIYPDLEDRDSGPLNWDTDASELHPSLETRASQPGKTNIGMDDCSSTCSSDSLPSVVSNGTDGRSSVIINIQTSPNQEKNHGGKDTRNRPTVSHTGKILDSCPSTFLELEGDVVPQKRSIQLHGIHLVQKQEAAAALPKKTAKDRNDTERQSNTRTLDSSVDPLRKAQQPVLQQAKQPAQNSTLGANTPTAAISLPSPIREPPSSILVAPKRSTALPAKSLHTSSSRYEAQKFSTTPSAKSAAAQPATAMSRPSSAPLIPVASRPIQPVISTVQVTPFLSRSASATGRLATDPSISAPSYVPQSYRNAIIGRTAAAAGSALAGLTPSTSSGQSSSTMFPPPSRKEQQMASGPGFTFGSVKPEALHIQQQQRNHNSHHGVTSGSISAASTLVIGIEQHQRESLSGTSSLQSYVGVADEFPHLDIINDLLDEEQSIMGRTASVSSQYYHPHHQPHHLFSRQYSFPGEQTSAELVLLNNSAGRFDHSDRYYDDSYLSLYDSSSGRVHQRSFTDVNLSAAAYANCQMDGLIQTQWPFSHSDLNAEGGGGYPYQQHSDYANMGSGLNGYGLYRP